jgi:hypothetical protein
LLCRNRSEGSNSGELKALKEGGLFEKKVEKSGEREKN